MSRIVHLALKVEDLERTTQFYREVFGFTEMSTDRVRDHTSRHLSDGTIDLALIEYDAGTQSAESRAAGEGRWYEDDGGVRGGIEAMQQGGQDGG